MDPPDASIHSGFAEIASRRAEAIRSGLVVDIGDVPTMLFAADERRAQTIAGLLGRLEPTTRDHVCALSFHDGALSPPDRPADDRVHDGYAWQSGSEFVFQHDSGLIATADASTIEIGGRADDLRWPFRRLFHPALTHVLAHRHRFVLHAAAVGDERGALLVLGGTGRGKSTTAMAALAAGWQVLGDDLVILAPHGIDDCDVMGVPRPMGVPRDVLASTDDVIDDGIYDGDPRERVQLSPNLLSSATSRIRGVVVSDHATTEHGSLERMPSETALGEMLTAFTATRNAPLRAAFFSHASALSRLPCWRLRLAGESTVRLREAVELLAGALDFGTTGRG